MIDNTDAFSTLNTRVADNRNMTDDSFIVGKITIIKNAGRPDEQIICKDKPNLLTNGGRDLFHAQCYTNTSAGTRGSGFIALSTDTTAPSTSDTTLTGEITTGGLGRADATTKTHTNGTNTTVLQHTYTASATHTAVQKCAMFNAASSGTMTHENTFTPVTLQSSDTLQITWTLTLG